MLFALAKENDSVSNAEMPFALTKENPQFYLHSNLLWISGNRKSTKRKEWALKSQDDLNKRQDLKKSRVRSDTTDPFYPPKF